MAVANNTQKNQCDRLRRWLWVWRSGV